MSVLMVWQGPTLSKAGQVNRAALDAMVICMQMKGKLAQTTPAFFQAGVARCLGDEEKERIFYQQALHDQQTRIEIIRAALPTDIDLARMAVENHPDEAESYFWFGELLALNENVADAIIVLEQGLAIDSSNAEGWDQLGRLYELQGHWQMALTAYDQACYYIDDGKHGCSFAGRLYLEHEMYNLAIERYKESLVQIPEHTDSLHGLVQTFILSGRSDEAIPYLELLVKKGDPEAQNLLEQLRQNPSPF